MERYSYKCGELQMNLKFQDVKVLSELASRNEKSATRKKTLNSNLYVALMIHIPYSRGKVTEFTINGRTEMWTLDRGWRTLQITKWIKDVVRKFAHRTSYNSTEMHTQLTLICTQPTESVYQSALCYVLMVSCYARFYNTLEWPWKDWQIWTKRHGNSLLKTVLVKQVSEQYVCFVAS